MVGLGITHCERCLSPLDDYGICKSCEEERIIHENKIKQKREEKIDQIVDLFFSLNEYEREGLKELIIEKGKEVKQRKLKQEIEKLKKEMEYTNGK